MTDMAGQIKPKRFGGFYAAISLFVVLIVIAGFWKGYWVPLFAGTLDKEWVVDLHAAVFVGWVSLFVGQALLAYKGRIDLHRRLGTFGIGYGIFIIFIGLLVTFNQFARELAAGNQAAAKSFLIVPLVDMMVFPAFFGAAVYFRGRPAFHKRLMLVATTELLTAPVARLDLDAYVTAHWSVFAIWLAPIYLAMVYDWVSNRIIHPVYVIGLVVLAASMARVLVMDSAAWQGIAGALAGLFS